MYPAVFIENLQPNFETSGRNTEQSPHPAHMPAVSTLIAVPCLLAGKKSGINEYEHGSIADKENPSNILIAKNSGKEFTDPDTTELRLATSIDPTRIVFRLYLALAIPANIHPIELGKVYAIPDTKPKYLCI